MFAWNDDSLGLQIRQYMRDNADYAIYLVFLYLGMILYGPGIAKALRGPNTPIGVTAKGAPIYAPDPAWLRGCMIVWNLFLSLFSTCAALVVLPAQFRALRRYGLHGMVCKDHPEITYTTACGLWTALFALSKIPELVDTVWLILQKRKTPQFLHWYHHASVLLFSWFCYTVGNSTMPVFAAMNLTVHSIMYFYFFLCACGVKKVVRPFAPLITLLQILQMVGGSALTFYSYMVNYKAYKAGVTNVKALPCEVSESIARFGCLMYLSYLYLFSRMFVSSYMAPKRPQAPKDAPVIKPAATEGHSIATNGRRSVQQKA